MIVFFPRLEMTHSVCVINVLIEIERSVSKYSYGPEGTFISVRVGKAVMACPARYGRVSVRVNRGGRDELLIVSP